MSAGLISPLARGEDRLLGPQRRCDLTCTGTEIVQGNVPDAAGSSVARRPHAYYLDPKLSAHQSPPHVALGVFHCLKLGNRSNVPWSVFLKGG
jgi:hypothetical protein